MWTKFQLCVSLRPWEKRDDIFLYLKIGKKNKEIKGRISSRNLVLFQIKQQMIHNTCTKLQNSPEDSSWEIFVINFPMYYIGVRDGKKEKEGKINLSFVFCLTIYLATLNVHTKFEDSGSHKVRKFVNKSSMLILFYTIQQVIPKYVPNFKTLGAVVPEKSLTQISLCITLEWEMEKSKNRKKKAKINLSILIFFPTIYLATLKVYTKLEVFGSHRSCEICDRNFYWRGRKMDK